MKWLLTYRIFPLILIFVFIACTEEQEPVPVEVWEFTLKAEPADSNIEPRELERQLAEVATILSARFPAYEDDSLFQVIYDGGDSILARVPTLISYTGEMPWYLGIGNVNVSLVAKQRKMQRFVGLMNSYTEAEVTAAVTSEQIADAFGGQETRSDADTTLFLTFDEETGGTCFFPLRQVNSYWRIAGKKAFQDSVRRFCYDNCRLAISLAPNNINNMEIVLLEGNATSIEGRILVYDSKGVGVTRDENSRIKLSAKSRSGLSKLTKYNVGRRVAILVDNFVLYSAAINYHENSGFLRFPLEGDSFEGYIIDKMLSGRQMPLQLRVVRQKTKVI